MLKFEILKSPFSRRRLLQAGSASLLGLTLPKLLAAREQASAAGRGSLDPARPEKSCIFIFQYGGLSQIDSWDPKPNAPEGIRGPYKTIATATPGFQVGELMPRLAKLSDHYAVIRSMTHTVPVHDVANRMLLAGQSKPPVDAPALGSIVTKVRPSTANVPSYVWLQKFGGGAAPPEPSYVNAGFLGSAHAPLVIGANQDDHPSNPDFRVTAFDTAEQITLDRLESRWRLLHEMQGGARGDGVQSPQSMDRFQQRAFDLLHGPQARAAFDVAQEPDKVRDRYGRHPLGQNLLLARRLVEAGVRLVSVVAWTGLAASDKFFSIETWDMHGNAGIGIFDNGWNGLGFALPRADEAVSALLEDLAERGLLDTTLVVLIGEFGRTPKISRGASAIGRDHWPHCYSAMLAGTGIRGGTVYGASDREGGYVKDRPVPLENFAATVFHALDIDPATRLSPDGFTRPASTGEAVEELF